MSSYQMFVAVGNLGRDPEMRYTPQGTPVTQFSIAVGRKYTRADGSIVDETAWFQCAAFGKLAENCNQYLTKGKRVLVEGEFDFDPKTGSPKIYTRKDGTAGTSFQVRTSRVVFLSPRGEGGNDNGSYADDATDDIGGMSEENLPF